MPDTIKRIHDPEALVELSDAPGEDEPGEDGEDGDLAI
jgi:hypothetical protein